MRLDPALCCSTETTVLAHLNGGGMGLKNPDMQGAFACFRCHAIVDGEPHPYLKREEVLIMFYEAILRTQRILKAEGLIITPGSK